MHIITRWYLVVMSYRSTLLTWSRVATRKYICTFFQNKLIIKSTWLQSGTDPRGGAGGLCLPPPTPPSPLQEISFQLIVTNQLIKNHFKIGEVSNFAPHNLNQPPSCQISGSVPGYNHAECTGPSNLESDQTRCTPDKIIYTLVYMHILFSVQ